MQGYEYGDLTRVVMTEMPDERANLVESVLPDNQAAHFHGEVHGLIMRACPLIEMVPLALQTACTMAQAGFVLGMQQGYQAAMDAADEVERFKGGDPDV